MAKRNEEKTQQTVAENQAETVQLSDQADSQDAIKVQETGEQSSQEETISDDKSAQTSATKPDLADGEYEAPADKPKLENLSVLADRHRISAWHQAALLRYMGWQDDKMVTDEAYRKALDELKHRRIGGGRK